MSSSFEFLQRIKTNLTRLLAGIAAETGRKGIALATMALVVLMIGGLFLIKFPLETVIVFLLIGSIMIMERG